LDVRTFWLGEPMGQPGDLGRGVGFLLDRVVGRIEFLPHGDDNEGEQHGVDHAQGGVDEACYVVVGLSRGGGNESLHQLQPRDRGEANRSDYEHAISYGE
jgi:hypothetical protein